MAAGDDGKGVQALSLAADQARMILQGQVTQIRLRPAAMADRLEPGALIWLREPYALPDFADRFAPTDWLARRPGDRSPQALAVHFLADGPKPTEFGVTRFARTLPRLLNRAFLRVTGVETDDLQRWSAADEAALGMTRDEYIAAWSATARAVASFGGDPTACAGPIIPASASSPSGWSGRISTPGLRPSARASRSQSLPQRGLKPLRQAARDRAGQPVAAHLSQPSPVTKGPEP